MLEFLKWTAIKLKTKTKVFSIKVSYALLEKTIKTVEKLKQKRNIYAGAKRYIMQSHSKMRGKYSFISNGTSKPIHHTQHKNMIISLIYVLNGE